MAVGLTPDLVVVGIGAAPRIALAQQPVCDYITRRSRSTRSCEPALPVFSPLATSPLPGIHATADRFELSTGTTRSDRARPSPLRSRATQAPYDRVPYLYSDQYDVGMEYRGLRPNGTRSSSAAIWTAANSTRSGSVTAESARP